MHDAPVVDKQHLARLQFQPELTGGVGDDAGQSAVGAVECWDVYGRDGVERGSVVWVVPG